MTSSHHPAGGHDHSGGPCDTRGRHGMLLFGEDPWYLSHLPMYDCPHNYQVLLEAGLDEPVAKILEADRARSPGALYTVDPPVFPLADLDPHRDTPPQTSLRATLVHGHFERGGTPIAEDARFDIHTVLRFHELDIEARAEVGQELRYLCFGRPGRLYLVHELKARPSFDQVLAVRMVPGTVRNRTGNVLDEDVRAYGFDAAQQVGVGRDDLVGQRLTAGETVTAWFDVTPSLSGARGFTVQMRVESELYLEINELA